MPTRRAAYKARSANSAFVAREDQKRTNDSRAHKQQEDDIIVDPFFSFQTMETVLGGQRMELHRLIHSYHETALKFLYRKEQTWRRADMEVKDLQSELDRLKGSADPRPSPQDKSLRRPPAHDKTALYLNDQLEKKTEQLAKRDAECRRAEAENFELREQLAAMQALGAGYREALSLTAGDPNSIPNWSPPLPASPIQQMPVHVQTMGMLSPTGFAVSPAGSKAIASPLTSKSVAVVDFLEKLDNAQSNPLERLERAQSKLDAWATGYYPKPDPIMAGMVDFNTMKIPPLPGSLDEKALDPNDPKNKELENKEKEKDDDDEEEEEEEPDTGDGAWSYFRAKKKKNDKKKKKALDMKDQVKAMFNSPSYAKVDPYKDTGFVAVENLFCVGFTAEIVFRFCAYRHTLDSLRDKWFVFDLVLVLLMIFETWLMYAVMKASAGGGQTTAIFDTTVLRIFRLFRLTRVARIARLLRLVPEVAILLKGIGVASRSVFFTVCLLVCVVYVFAIVLTQLSKDTQLGESYFPTLSDSMFQLLFVGCFNDGLPAFARACFKEHLGYGLLICVFLLIAQLTVMNMCVGVLVEVVGIVAAAEQESMTITMVSEQLWSALSKVDENNDGTIDKNEFLAMANMPDVVATFTDAGIDAMALVRDPDIIFAGDESMGFQEMLDEVLMLRGSNPATVKDIVQLKKQLLRELKGVVGRRPGMPALPAPMQLMSAPAPASAA
eukprot:TRINITY_DN24199_c0_g1_i1.p1 TRINITY_DN24199_c0_g1~~TRINITY_DN24199_c0_g1_i1.p1  ORF type:complete len:743 (+),score=157.77 TRINITY_DN24199_c0_g1_i1:63-2231(+)